MTMKYDSDYLKRKYYSYNGTINILIFVNIFANIKFISLAYNHDYKYFTICFIVNSILIGLMTTFGSITLNIETILKSEYSIKIKDTGNFLTNEGVSQILYPSLLVVMNIVLLFFTNLKFIQSVIIFTIAFIIPIIIGKLINRKYLNIIRYINRQNKIKSYY